MIRANCKDVYGSEIEFNLETAVLEEHNMTMLGILNKDKVSNMRLYRLCYNNGTISILSYEEYLKVRNRMFLNREVI